MGSDGSMSLDVEINMRIGKTVVVTSMLAYGAWENNMLTENT